MRTLPRIATALLASAAAAVSLTAPAHAATPMSVLSFNIWQQGGNVSDGFNKIVSAIRSSGANVVSLQETSSAFTTQVADALGWNHTNAGRDVDVISSLPIDSRAQTVTASGATVAGALIGGRWVYSTHLDWTRYGPYNACFDHDSNSVILADEANRRQQATEVVAWGRSSSPTILAGDFNTPSHQDWTARTAGTHCGYTVAWPTTQAVTGDGYTDSFRAAYPNEQATPGNTWSPVVKTNSNGQPEPQDRIDFVFGKGVSSSSSRTYGGGASWPSDHLAVLSTYP